MRGWLIPFLHVVWVTLIAVGVWLSFVSPIDSYEWHEEIVVPFTFSEPLFPMLIMIIASIFLGIAYIMLCHDDPPDRWRSG